MILDIEATSTNGTKVKLNEKRDLLNVWKHYYSELKY